MSELEFKNFTGTIEGIGSRREAGKGQRKVEIKAKSSDQYNKTFRCWEHAYDEEKEGPGDEKSEVFELLEQYYEDGTRTTVTFYERPYEVTSRGKKETRTQNVITDCYQANDEEPAGEWEPEEGEAEEKPKKVKKGSKKTSQDASDDDADDAAGFAGASEKLALRVAEIIVEHMKKAGLVLMKASDLGQPEAPEGPAEEIYDDFAKQAQEKEEIGEKAIEKKFRKLFSTERSWKTGTMEELTALAEALDFEWE